MAIVLNENKWAKEMIDNRTLGKKPSETLRRVARYYFDEGLDKRKTRQKLESFLVGCDQSISIPKWADSIEFALSCAKKREAISIDRIVITEPEMERIGELGGAMVQRLAFTLLCLAKYWDAATKRDVHWVNSKDSDIMRMANINTSIKRQSAMYNDLYTASLIRFSKRVDNTNVQVQYVCDGKTAVEVTDLRNLGYQYGMYREPNKYLKCENCGIVVKQTSPNVGRPQKYCRECAVLLDLRQRVESVMRQRNNVRRK